MISVTTPTVENGVIVEYKGIVTGQVVNGVNFIKDFGASIRNIVGGRSAGYEEELESARQAAIRPPTLSTIISTSVSSPVSASMYTRYSRSS